MPSLMVIVPAFLALLMPPAETAADAGSARAAAVCRKGTGTVNRQCRAGRHLNSRIAAVAGQVVVAGQREVDDRSPLQFKGTGGRR